MEEVIPFRHLYVIAGNDGLGAAQEAALKLLETNYLPVSCYPLDEYIHGVQNALDVMPVSFACCRRKRIPSGRGC